MEPQRKSRYTCGSIVFCTRQSRMTYWMSALLFFVYAIFYFPWEISPISGLEQAKFYFALILIIILLINLIFDNNKHFIIRIMSSMLILLLYLLTIISNSKINNWLWGINTELITFPIITFIIYIIIIFIFSYNPFLGQNIVKGLAVASIALYPTGILAALGILESLGYTPFLHRTTEFFPRAFTWPSQGYAAGVFAPFATFFLIDYTKNRKNILSAVAASTLLAIMLAGGNRTGPVAFMLASASVVLFGKVTLKSWARAFLAVTALSAFLYTVYSYPISEPSTFERGLHGISTLNSRIYLWEGALSVLRSHPFGVGPDRFYSVLAMEKPDSAETIAKKHGLIPEAATEVTFLSSTPLVRMKLPGIDQPVFIRLGTALAHNGFLDIALAYGIPIALLIYVNWFLWMRHLLKRKELPLFSANVALFLYSLLWAPIFSVFFPFIILNVIIYNTQLTISK